MEQLVILLIIAAISFINWLMQKSAEHKERRARERRADSGEPDAATRTADLPESGPPAFDAEEQTRKFLEALGLPAEGAPPPPVVQRAPQPPPIPSEPSPVRRKSFLHKLDPDIERRLMPDEPQEDPWARPVADRVASVVRRRVAPTVTSSAPNAAAIKLRELLASRDGLQSAILAREIVGPPKGLAGGSPY